MDTRGTVGRIYKEDHYTLLHTKYESSGSCGFEVFVFYVFFPIVSLWELSVAMFQLRNFVLNIQVYHYGLQSTVQFKHVKNLENRKQNQRWWGNIVVSSIFFFSFRWPPDFFFIIITCYKMVLHSKVFRGNLSARF